MTISLQHARRDHLDLALPRQRDFIPLVDRRLRETQRTRQGGLRAEMLDCLLFSHGKSSMAYRTNNGKDTIRTPIYAVTMNSANLLTITDRILYAMQEAGIKQKTDLARRCGVSKQTIGDWTKGRTENLKPENLVTLADALEVEIRWLATGKGPRQKRLITPKIEEAALILGVMDQDTRAAYLAVLKHSNAA